MPPKKKKKRTKRKRNRHIKLVLFLIVVVIFFFFEEFNKDKPTTKIDKSIEPPGKINVLPPDFPPKRKLPKVAIVIDDLGPNKEAAQAVLDINAPLTLSILPQEVYTSWIAHEGHKLGRDIIGHIPMQATRPLKLGNGGLYTWMTDQEIVSTLEENIRSIPNIIGASNHMGSAFTEDERAMEIVIKELKEQGLFFLDSITTPKSTGRRLSRIHGVSSISRDIFLDDDNAPDAIRIQWERLIKVAKRNGRAIALGHPRKNTVAFLKKTLDNNQDIMVVPLSELLE